MGGARALFPWPLLRAARQLSVPRPALCFSPLKRKDISILDRVLHTRFKTRRHFPGCELRKYEDKMTSLNDMFNSL